MGKITKKQDINILFIAHGGAHPKIFSILHNNFHTTSLMQKKFKHKFGHHFKRTGKIDIIFPKSLLDLFFKTRKNMKKKDFIVANCPISGTISYLTCLFSNKKRVFLMCQDYYEYFSVAPNSNFKKWWNGKLLKLMVRLSCRKALVITLSNHIKNSAINKYGAKNVEIIPVYGVDMDIFKPKKTNIDFKTNKKIVLATARAQAPEKGVDCLIKAISSIKDVMLIRTCDPTLDKKLNKLAKDLGMKDRFKVVGDQDTIRIADYYNACDIFVLPSLKEGLGFSSAEAMACKKPVIASNTGGIPDIVIHNETGLLVEPGNVVELKEAIEKILSSKKLRDRLIENGYRHVKKNYQEKDVVAKFIDTLIRIKNKKSS